MNKMSNQLSSYSKGPSLRLFVGTFVTATSLILAGCGSSLSGSPSTPGAASGATASAATSSSPNSASGGVPEAHGSMPFHDATQQEAQQPANTQMTGVATAPDDGTGDGAAPSNVGANLPNASQPARHDLCADQYDSTKTLPDGLVCPRCERGEFTQPGIARKKLDIVFVADTSPSLTDTRDSIAKSVSQFVAALPHDTDYHIAVIPSHSDVSYDEKVAPSSHLGGKVFFHPGEQPVLSGGQAGMYQSLEARLKTMPLDSATDGGEAGIYSLHLAINEPLLSQNRKLGIFRPDAALAVIFISDENDICSWPTDYPAGVERKKSPSLYAPTKEEVELVAGKFFCADKGITSKSVYNELRQLMKLDGAANEARPLLLSGIVYTSPDTVPTTMPAGEPFPQYFAEKEMGYGYLNMVGYNNGVAVDIGKANYNEGLGQIGQAAAEKLQVKSEFQLKDGVALDPNTVCVMVDGKEATALQDFSTPINGFSYMLNSDTREVQLRGVGATSANGSASKVDIFYCEPPSVTNINPELFSRKDLPTTAEHYRGLPVPSACQTLRKRIQSGALDNG